jgi:hypothetical protein
MLGTYSRYKDYTYEQLLNEAYGVQDACNLSGVLLSFAEVVCRLRELGKPTYDRPDEPVIQMFADKVWDMCGRPSTEQVFKAFDLAELKGESND